MENRVVWGKRTDVKKLGIRHWHSTRFKVVC